MACRVVFKIYVCSLKEIMSERNKFLKVYKVYKTVYKVFRFFENNFDLSIL